MNGDTLGTPKELTMEFKNDSKNEKVKESGRKDGGEYVCTEVEHYNNTSKLNFRIRFIMMLFIGLNILVSFMSFVVQIKVWESPDFIQDSFKYLGFGSLDSIYNLLPIWSVSSYILTAIGYFIVICYFFIVYEKNYQEVFNGIKTRVILFVVFVEAIMISRSLAYFVINYPCTISKFCPKCKENEKDHLKNYGLLEISKQFILVTELVGTIFISYVALKSHEVDTC